jgi:Homeodomain-like domain
VLGSQSASRLRKLNLIKSVRNDQPRAEKLGETTGNQITPSQNGRRLLPQRSARRRLRCLRANAPGRRRRIAWACLRIVGRRFPTPSAESGRADQRVLVHRQFDPANQQFDPANQIAALRVDVFRERCGADRRAGARERGETVLKWYRRLVACKFDGSCSRRAPGRPPIGKEIEELIVRMAKENRSWGYDRIVEALANLGREVSDQTVGNVLRHHGIPPVPERRGTTTWAELETDFFIAAEVLTLRDWSLWPSTGPRASLGGKSAKERQPSFLLGQLQGKSC